MDIGKGEAFGMPVNEPKADPFSLDVYVQFRKGKTITNLI